jgi:hypothetical protein
MRECLGPPVVFRALLKQNWTAGSLGPHWATSKIEP